MAAPTLAVAVPSLAVGWRQAHQTGTFRARQGSEVFSPRLGGLRPL